MKKTVRELKNKTAKELFQEINKMRVELAKLTITQKSNPAKDRNTVMKKKKQLARMLTALTEKNQLEKIKKL
ncbi:50S ribosomal protein L29 [Candidatus Roizmanbacteria bacterium RIFCSPLOWO2_01_FULL_44_13]|uniref:Large ribosomal subunit protein uL29 n=1 Tax=Candidatus Roizmanbacteria bacterium RIFCSPLOWO2_01_FULL_44_13 TaxID=1802069 RepID=A0A1F7J9L9_9BACT|nr:MAG: 50S ribosomal protein L29 [Candidatus Roizmanbacteria bacterium RIFCSPLOWO2_01_FULL_44_13]